MNFAHNIILSKLLNWQSIDYTLVLWAILTSGCKDVSFEATFLLLLSSPLGLGQAPGDYDPGCREGQLVAPLHVFPEAWEVVLDSYDYQNLYDEGLTIPPVWVARSFDTDADSNVSR